MKDNKVDCGDSIEDDYIPALVDTDAEIEMHGNTLPHWQQKEATQFVTWRLWDSLPKAKLDQWEAERNAWMSRHPKPWDEKTTKQYHHHFSYCLDEWLDMGSGSCLLRDHGIRKIVADSIQHFNGERYRLWAFVITPNHVHVLFSLLAPNRLEDILHSWKSYSANIINKKLNRKGKVWQRDYWDHLVRNEKDFYRLLQYVKQNPEKSRLSGKEFTLYLKVRIMD
jgi:REP element-mobilizing transposase RayT